MGQSVGIAGRTEKLENHLNVLYSLLEDVLYLQNGAGEIRNADVRSDLDAIARHVGFDWIRRAVRKSMNLSSSSGAISRNPSLWTPWSLNCEAPDESYGTTLYTGDKYLETSNRKLIRPSLTDVKEPKEQACSENSSRRSRSRPTRRMRRTSTTSSRCSRRLRWSSF